MHARSPLCAFAPVLTLLLAVPATAQRAAVATLGEPVDVEAVEILRREGLENSQVMEHLSWICDVHGPRLTGSPGIKRARMWAVSTLQEWGFENVHLDEWGPFGRGWQLDGFSMHVVGDNPWPVLAWPKAWSPALDGEVTAKVIDANAMSADELREIDLTDKIVLMETPRELTEWFDGTASRFDAERLWTMATGATPDRGQAGRSSRGNFRAGFQRRQAVMAVLRDNRPLMILDRSYKGDYGTLFVTGASALPSADGERRSARQQGAEVIPQVTLSVEHYNRISRLLAKNIQVRLSVSLDARFFDDDTMENNVIAEIPGTDPNVADQVVMLGAHFDSWHTGTGATDNGCGSAVMMEAMRLIKVLIDETGTKPRRTIRLGLWSGEEQGLLGSRAYVSKHLAVSGGRRHPPAEILPDHAKFSGYFNLDNGTGRVRGVYLQGNEKVAPIFRAWLKPFHDLDAATLTLSNTGGTDHQAFDGVGLPGFQFIQDPVAYSTRTHHSNMDVWDHAVAADLQQASTIIASFAWHTAQRDGMLPRKPMPKPSAAVEASTPRRRGR